MRAAKRNVSATASGRARNSRAISSGGFRCRSALACKPLARLRQRHMLADAGDDILQGALVGMMIERVIDRDQRRPAFARQAFQCFQPAAVFAGIKHGGRQPGIRPSCFRR